MSFANAQSFLDALQRLRLLNAAQIEEAARVGVADARTLAKAFVERGLLTSYQVNELFLGRGANLALGSYVLLEKLGEGGMGAVFKARNWKLDKIVALKILRKERLGNAEVVKRFYREIRAAAQLDHPNIVGAYDADEAGGMHFFVMEFVEGADLNKLVKSQAVSVAGACDIIRQAALGLQHAFERGLVHRDIKPANLVLVTPETAALPTSSDLEGSTVEQKPPPTVVKILDMGLARLDDAVSEESATLTREGAVMGTPDYIAPEQARSSHTVDIRADLYSLGCTLYFLLTRQAPFPGGTLTQKLLKHQLEEAVPVERLRPDVPEGVAAIVRRLMAKDPGRRYQTPAELVTALDNVGTMPTAALAGAGAEPAVATASGGGVSSIFAHLGEGESSLLVNTPSTIIPPRPVERWKLYAVIGGPALLGIAILTFVLWSRWNQTDPEAPPSGPPFGKLPVKPGPDEIPGEVKKKTEDELAAARQKRIQAAVDALALLKAKGTTAEARAELARFRLHYLGTAAAQEAAELLKAMPSPLTKLLPLSIPDDAREAWLAARLDIPDTLAAVLGEHRQRHWGGGGAIAFGGGGDLLASAGFQLDPVIRIWDAATLELRATLRKDGVPSFRALVFAPHQETLYCLGGDGRLHVWDVHSGKHLRSGLASGTSCLAVAPDGSRLALATSKVIRLLDAVSLEEVGTPMEHSDAVTFLTFSPKGDQVLSGGAQVLVWDATIGKKLLTLPGHPKQSVAGAVFAPDGAQIVSVAYNGALKVWDVATGKEVAGGAAGGAVTGFAPTSDGRMFLGRNDGPIALVEGGSKKPLRTMAGHDGRIRALALTADGKRLASTGDDGTVRLWDVDSGKQLFPVKPVAEVRDVAFSLEESTLLAPTTLNQAHAFDLPTGRAKALPKNRTGPLLAACAPAEGQVFLTEGDFVFLWNSAAADDLWRARITRDGRGEPLCVALSTGGDRGLSGHYDGLLRVWNGKTGLEDMFLEAHKAPIFSVALSPDARFALSGSDASKGQPVLRLWDLARRVEVRAMEKPARITALLFANDQKTAWSGANTGAISLWDLESGKEGKVYKGHTDQVLALSLSPDGRYLASTGNDRQVIVWDIKSEGKVGQWRLPGAALAVNFSHDGRYLATGNANGTAYVFRLPATP